MTRCAQAVGAGIIASHLHKKAAELVAKVAEVRL
ncbi:hypothetical protein OYT1_ch0393 [Ferriphaselus amnicola]|jgi:hypothetical protein|uniref:Uncharacterized protein n=1 Tax=Ferriphaselus amnicola TaxID=1188319 RepID=A0A2Z6G909_9PROT|nr:hypothetical protein OYT1_ch0393 [Ferriphaselus amnicola]